MHALLPITVALVLFPSLLRCSSVDVAIGIDGETDFADDFTPRTPSNTPFNLSTASIPSWASGSNRFINRELSWLRFNERVLDEASNLRHPLFERLRFLSISANNLDEFYMVRVAGLKGQAQAGVVQPSIDGQSPAGQLVLINQRAGKLIQAQQRVWRQLADELASNAVRVVKPSDLAAGDRAWLDAHFQNEVFPQLTPLSLDPAHPFPFLANKGYGLALQQLGDRDGESRRMMGLLLFPPTLQRFILLPPESPATTALRFVTLESLVLDHLDELFPGFKLLGWGIFRILRDSEVEIDEEAVDLVRTFVAALKRRRKGHVISLVVDATMPGDLVRFLMERFDVQLDDMFVVEGIVGVGDVKQLITDTRPELTFTPYIPRYPERIRDFGGDVFAAIRSKDILLHHPFESFDLVVQFIELAARDPAVLSIKQTLYRTSDKSPIVRALIEAAEAGKSVTALIELKARFDEEANIRYALDMERAGVQVVYGFLELKTHAKVAMVVRREGRELHSYVHFGTGNYHPLTAKIYTDLSLFSADPPLVRDAAKLFNFMTGYATPTGLEKIAAAPLTLRSTLVSYIGAEIANARAGRPSGIFAKMNALVDPEIIDQLYAASQAGVEVNLVVRGMCCLRPGVPGLSEHIHVKSIVGRFLEHSRIVIFANGGMLPSASTLVFMSSADWMTRNLDWRVESLVPLENETVRKQVIEQIMMATLNDTAHSWSLQPDGEYLHVPQVSGDAFSSHDYFMLHPSLSGRGSHRGDLDGSPHGDVPHRHRIHRETDI